MLSLSKQKQQKKYPGQQKLLVTFILKQICTLNWRRKLKGISERLMLACRQNKGTVKIKY